MSKNSILGFNYQQKQFDERLAKTIFQRFDLPEILCNLLASKNIALDEIEEFLNPKIKTSLPNPFGLKDMDKGVSHLIEAIKNNKKIVIFGDYDVDGATSSAILKRFLRDVYEDCEIYIPDRILEGYGPNSNALLKLKEQGVDLVITLDCGTVSFEPLLKAKEAGLDVIVIDHHIGVSKKPEALAIINPNSLDDNFEHKNLCAAGVTFLFIVAVNKVLREQGFYNPKLKPLPESLHSSTLPQGEGDKMAFYPPLEGGSKSLISGRGNFIKAQKFYSSAILIKAKELRKNQTNAENLIWYYLQNKQLDGHKFRRQQPVENYILDFVCFEKNLIIELDGGQHNESDAIKYDKKRTEFLEKSGFRVLRFWNNEIFENVNNVLDKILFELSNPSPKSKISTLPQGEGDKMAFYPPLEGGSKSLISGRGKKEPNLLNFLDLVALGTVCDVMKLTGINRAFVSAGLKILKQRQNLGLKTICDLAKINEEPSAYHLGFIIGPRINAGGRVGNSNLGAELLSTLDENKALEIAEKLELLNKERKDIEARVLKEAISQLEEEKIGFSKNNQILFVASKNWHQGVIGIVASRLKDLYQKPAIVIAIDEKENKAKASCRSISQIDLGCEILNARMEGLLLDGGGHAMAGGFSVLPEKIQQLYEFFDKNLSEKISEVSKNKLIEFDLSLDLEQINLEILREISKLEPFGIGNSKPKFILKNLIKLNSKAIGADLEHVSATFSSKSAIGFNSQIQAVAFKATNNEIGKILLNQAYKKPIDLVGTLNINSWLGQERIQIVIEDLLI